jgi:hypothetical protein
MLVAETRKQLDSIDKATAIGVRDRALVAVDGLLLARVGARARVCESRDVFTDRRQSWVRLREKGGKAHPTLSPIITKPAPPPISIAIEYRERIGGHLRRGNLPDARLLTVALRRAPLGRRKGRHSHIGSHHGEGDGLPRSPG